MHHQTEARVIPTATFVNPGKSIIPKLTTALVQGYVSETMKLKWIATKKMNVELQMYSHSRYRWVNRCLVRWGLKKYAPTCQSPYQFHLGFLSEPVLHENRKSSSSSTEFFFLNSKWIKHTKIKLPRKKRLGNKHTEICESFVWQVKELCILIFSLLYIV